MQTLSRPPVPVVVLQYGEGASQLRNNRTILVRAPHVKLHQLRRLDDRLAAHLDGLAVSGEAGRAHCQAALETLGTGTVFTATVRAIQDHDTAALDKLIALSEAVEPVRAGLASAFGWVAAAELRGVTAPLLESPNPFRRRIGLAACAMHQVDPGPALLAAIVHADAGLRAYALRAAANGGRRDLLPACLAALTDDVDDCRFQAARAALLLGDPGAALGPLQVFAMTSGPHQISALALLITALAPPEAHAPLKALAANAEAARALIRGVGWAGDSHYVPWLIKQMDDAALARLAGESFSLMTGLDLAEEDLECRPPEGVNTGPNDDPNDANVALDEDENLPWPDPRKIAVWWQAGGHRFAPGTRHFMGEVPSLAHGFAVLKNGFQRQRIAAADYLCLMNPGTPIFNTAAPAWRQQRLLAQMPA